MLVLESSKRRLPRGFAVETRAGPNTATAGKGKGRPIGRPFDFVLKPVGLLGGTRKLFRRCGLFGSKRVLLALFEYQLVAMGSDRADT